MSCSGEDKYTKDGRCCDKCPAGRYAEADCTDTEKTLCLECPSGSFAAAKNGMRKCVACRQCNASNLQRVLQKCTGVTDTVCECESGKYCDLSQCDLCHSVTNCPPGEGVKVQPTRTNDTVCAPCGAGTYSNTSDFISACRPHTRCEDLGRDLKTTGTTTTDAVCGGFKSTCAWALPAGLWAGFLLTLLLVVALFIYWRRKRRSNTKVKTNVPVQLVDMVAAEPQFLPPKANGHYQESCEVPLMDPVDSAGPRSTVTKVSDPDPVTGSWGLPRVTSEPQEDEWCGSCTGT